MKKLETRKWRHIERQLLRKQINREYMEEFFPEEKIGKTKEEYSTFSEIERPYLVRVVGS